MPSCMDVNTHKVSGKLIICLAMACDKSKNHKQTEDGENDFQVLVLEVDHFSDYSMRELSRRRI